MEERQNKKLRMIYNHFGAINQENKLYEEIQEYLESGELEEIADMWVLLTQRYLASKPMRDIVKFKIDRTLDRINERYYEEKTV